MIEKTVDARTNRIDAEQAWDMVNSATRISVAKGKKVIHFDEIVDAQADVLKKIMGPTGNLRAPSLKVGDTYIVGFNLDLYEQAFTQ